jgi:hypothetical protein
VHGLHRMNDGHGKSFWAYLMVLLRDVYHVEACFRPFEIVLISTQDRCTVCAECTVGSEIALGTPHGTPTWRRSSGRSFQSVCR